MRGVRGVLAGVGDTIAATRVAGAGCRTRSASPVSRRLSEVVSRQDLPLQGAKNGSAAALPNHEATGRMGCRDPDARTHLVELIRDVGRAPVGWKTTASVVSLPPRAATAILNASPAGSAAWCAGDPRRAAGRRKDRSGGQVQLGARAACLPSPGRSLGDVATHLMFVRRGFEVALSGLRNGCLGLVLGSSRTTLAAGRPATTATIRRALISVLARIASSARRLTLHLPTAWPWHDHDPWTQLFTRACGPPPATPA